MRRVYLQDNSETHEEYKNTIDEYCHFYLEQIKEIIQKIIEKYIKLETRIITTERDTYNAVEITFNNED